MQLGKRILEQGLIRVDRREFQESFQHLGELKTLYFLIVYHSSQCRSVRANRGHFGASKLGKILSGFLARISKIILQNFLGRFEGSNGGSIQPAMHFLKGQCKHLVGGLSTLLGQLIFIHLGLVYCFKQAQVHFFQFILYSHNYIIKLAHFGVFLEHFWLSDFV